MTFSASNSNLNKRSKQELTRWDLFVCVAGRPEGIALARLAHVLHVERERSLIRPLGSLVDDDLLIDEGSDRYTISTSKKAQALKGCLAYALAYNYDYNAYLCTDMVEFLRKAYRSDYFTEYDVPKEAITPAVVARLIHNDMLLVYSYKPFMGKIIQNPFLDGICAFLGIKRFGVYFFRRKIQIERVIKDKLAAQAAGKDPQVRHAYDLLGSAGLKDDGWGLGPTSQLIRDSVEKEDTDVFDPESADCYKSAWERMHANVKRGEPLSLKTIKMYHQMSMANTLIAGSFREHQVVVRNNPSFKTADPRDISKLLTDLVNVADSIHPTDIDDILELAAYVYNQFIFIHPFEDGNSRTARIILAHLLNRNNMPFEEIPSAYQVRFLETTKGLKKRNDDALKYLLEEVYLNYINRQELELAKKHLQEPAS